MSEKQFKADGKDYRFSPGKDGSLTAVQNVKRKPIYTERPHVARAVPILREMRKRYAMTGAVRG